MGIFRRNKNVSDALLKPEIKNAKASNDPPSVLLYFFFSTQQMKDAKVIPESWSLQLPTQKRGRKKAVFDVLVLSYS